MKVFLDDGGDMPMPEECKQSRGNMVICLQFFVAHVRLAAYSLTSKIVDTF
jgi:hypothetical protein